MTVRYYARDWDTCGDVWDTVEKRVVSEHALIRDAEAEAVRLNAAGVKRAEPVDGWAMIPPSGRILIPWVMPTKTLAAMLKRKEYPHTNQARIARVEIREIADDE